MILQMDKQCAAAGIAIEPEVEFVIAVVVPKVLGDAAFEVNKVFGAQVAPIGSSYGEGKVSDDSMVVPWVPVQVGQVERFDCM